MFLKVRNSNQNFNLKKVLKCLKFGLSWGKNGRYALCDAISRHFGVYCRKQKKLLMENCFENMVSEVNKKWFKIPQTYF